MSWTTKESVFDYQDVISLAEGRDMFLYTTSTSALEPSQPPVQ
jgi:hypothetical protein